MRSLQLGPATDGQGEGKSARCVLERSVQTVVVHDASSEETQKPTRLCGRPKQLNEIASFASRRCGEQFLQPVGKAVKKVRVVVLDAGARSHDNRANRCLGACLAQLREPVEGIEEATPVDLRGIDENSQPLSRRELLGELSRAGLALQTEAAGRGDILVAAELHS